MRTAAIVLAAATMLTGCASVPLFTARDDIHRFFVAVRDNDQATFDTFVSQQGLAQSIRSVRCFNAGHRGRPLLDCVAPGNEPLKVIPITAFRGIAASYGYRPGRRSSGPVGIPLHSRTFDQVCVAKSVYGDCLLTFYLEGDRWRLLGISDPTRLEGV